MSDIKALLLDLDDTLLLNDMETFGQHYFEALLAKVAPICPSEPFVKALRAGMQAMFDNDGTRGSNADVFAASFFAQLPCEPQKLLALLDEFYRCDFEVLRVHTTPDPDARRLVSTAFARGYQVAIATQPVFPLPAILARLRWAGAGADEFPYDYVSSYETMSACKPHPAFFQTLVERLGREPDECLMVGDDPEADMAAGRLGLKTFWVKRGAWRPRHMYVSCDARGSLAELIKLIETGRIYEL
ncbi:MAG: HAD family hydrolase [Chloroflexi bacterium]|nr:HAD family hydrolase [Chloroflexota bacterium]